MIRKHHYDDLMTVKRTPENYTTRCDGRAHEREVDLGGDEGVQVRLRVTGCHVELDRRVAAAIFGHDVGRKAPVPQGERRDAQTAGDPGQVVSQGGQRTILDPHEASRVLYERLAGGSQMNLASVASEELDPELALEDLDALGDGRLGQLQACGRPAIVAGVCYRDKSAEVAQLQCGTIVEVAIDAGLDPGRAS